MDKRVKLQEIWQKLEADVHTLPLGNIGENTVPGEGNPDSPIMYIGEAPGYNESVERRPFVGRSGQLFVQTSAEVGFPRQDVYITNIVKVRPPENRDPTPEEIAAYKPYLDEEIQIIQPKLIITLGRMSMGKFLPDVKISQVHGRLHKLRWNQQQIFVLPMYHPAAALRNPTMKASFLADFQKIPKVLAWLNDQHDTDLLEAGVKEAFL